ncbi:MAG: glycosyltransferase family 9 protein [Nanoarchaeota archaeon]
MEEKNVSKILILDFLAIGDLLFTTPLLKTLRHNYPQTEIAISINKGLEQILKYNPNIDKIIPFDKNGEHKGLNYLKYIKTLRDEKPDLTITLQDNPRLSILALFSGARKRVGFAKHIRKLFYTDPIQANHNQHRVDYYLDITQKLNINGIINDGLEMYISKKSKIWAKTYLNKITTERKTLIGLNIGGSWETKLWPVEKFANLADILLQKNYQVILLGGPGDITRENKIKAKMRHSPLSLVGKTSLNQLAAICEILDLVVSGDTGPLHMAVAMNTKTIALFGPTEVWRYRPYEEKHIVIKGNLACQPCHKKTCPFDRVKCMDNIGVQQVYSIIEGELK